MRGDWNHGVRGKVTWGVFLMGLGVLFLLGEMGWVRGDVWVHLWPLWPALFGVSSLVGARRAKEVGSGVFMLGLAGYLYVSNESLWGLHWGRSWPLVIVAVGLSSLAEVIAARFMPEPVEAEAVVVEEEHHA